METVNGILNCLEHTPVVLVDVLQRIPQDLYQVRRVEGKWSIHEQVCHLIEAQSVLMDRFRQFEQTENPLIVSYEPTEERGPDHYLEMDMPAALGRFPGIRKAMLDELRSYPLEYWERTGRHEAFEPYGTRILLTHTLNVDYAHLFSIEQLGLTKEEYVQQILTIP